MSIPSNITTELTDLEAQVQAASPLASASYATVKAMQLNAGNLVNDIQTALTATNVLDTWAAPIDPISIIAGFQTVATAGDDQSNLALMRGVVGRATANLEQLT